MSCLTELSPLVLLMTKSCHFFISDVYEFLNELIFDLQLTSHAAQQGLNTAHNFKYGPSPVKCLVCLLTGAGRVV